MCVCCVCACVGAQMVQSQGITVIMTNGCSRVHSEASLHGTSCTVLCHYHWTSHTASHIYILPFGGDTNPKYSTPGCYSTPLFEIEMAVDVTEVILKPAHRVGSVDSRKVKNYTVSSKWLAQFFHRGDYCFQCCDKHIQGLSLISGTTPVNSLIWVPS